jgi:hypothetical protein
MSCSAYRVIINLAAIAAANPPFDLLPRQAQSRIILEVRFPACQFFFLPIMHRNRFGNGRVIVPKIFYELEFFPPVSNQISNPC